MEIKLMVGEDKFADVVIPFKAEDMPYVVVWRNRAFVRDLTDPSGASYIAQTSYVVPT